MAVERDSTRLSQSKLLLFWVAFLFVCALLFHASRRESAGLLSSLGVDAEWLSWGTVNTGTENSFDPALTVELLETRLQKLETLPVQSYAQALARNSQLETCAGRGIQQNLEQYGRRKDFWHTLSDHVIVEKRGALAAAVRASYSRINATEAYGTGRGIVYTGGNKNTLERLLVSLRFLREVHKSTLPVEIFSFKSEAQAKGVAQTIEAIRALGNVTFRDLAAKKNTQLWKNFQIKGEAVRESSFSQLLYLDSDNIPLTDPAYLFDHPLFAERGAVLWPDFHKEGPENPIWRILDMPCRRNDWALESGQMLFDKRGQQGMNLAALIIAEAMQVVYDFWFKVSEGDKDTFRYGLWALGLDYTPAPYWSGTFGFKPSDAQTDKHKMCGMSILHYGLSPSDWKQYPSLSGGGATVDRSHAPPLFVHSNLLKHSNGISHEDMFAWVKRAKEDRVDRNSDDLRAAVYELKDNSLCVDIQHTSDEAANTVMEDASSAYGGVLRRFRENYFAMNGLGGGGW